MEGNFTNRYFVPILAATDLLAATVCSSFQIAANLMQVIFFNTYLCKIWTLSAFTTYLSVLILLIIAVQRYLKVIKRAGRQMDLKFNRVALLCAFVVSALMAAPTMIFYGAVPVLSRDGFSIQGMRCSIIDGDNKVWFIIYGSVLGLLAIMIIIILTGVYMRIGWVIFRQMKLNKKYSKENAITTKESTDRDSLRRQWKKSIMQIWKETTFVWKRQNMKRRQIINKTSIFQGALKVLRWIKQKQVNMAR